MGRHRGAWMPPVPFSSVVVCCVLTPNLDIPGHCCLSSSVLHGPLVDLGDSTSPGSTGSTSSPDSDLQLAMELSAQAQEEEERRRRQEEEDLERILKLSLTEK